MQLVNSNINLNDNIINNTPSTYILPYILANNNTNPISIMNLPK